MAEALFYHLTIRTLETALPDLLARTYARGWRAVVRCGSPERAEDLNRLLWSYDAGAFLPHGVSADGEAARQPIYLTAGDETPNAPDVLFLVDGATASPTEIAAVTRACLMFDGRDESAVGKARTQWREIAAAEIPAVYWAEEPGGKWVKKAEKGG